MMNCQITVFVDDRHLYGYIRHFLAVCPHGLTLCDGNVAVYVFDINQPSFSTPIYSVLVSASVFMALSIVFHSINSPENSPLSHCILPVFFFCLLVPYNCISPYESLPQS